VQPQGVASNDGGERDFFLWAVLRQSTGYLRGQIEQRADCATSLFPRKQCAHLAE